MTLILFILQAIALALSQIWANKVRSCLTALGIIVGVAGVTWVIAILGGFKEKLLTQVESFGVNKMFIFPDRPDDAPRNKYPWEEIRLKPAELEALSEHCPSIAGITPMTTLGAVLQYRDRMQEGVTVKGIWPDWHDIEARQVIMGRPFVPSDEEDAQLVCLVNESAIEELALPKDPTGHALLVNGWRFLIVGVVETLQASIFGPNTTQAEVLIPFSTAVKQQDSDFFFYLIARTISPDVSEEAKAEARFVLRSMRQLEGDEPDTFQIEAIDQFIDQFKKVAAMVTVVASCLVGVALLVGGIGIMNIMLVSVSERTREIGLRKAVGATSTAILLQFLLEAVTLSILGGGLGLGIGKLAALPLTLIENGLDRVPVPMWAIVVSFGASGFVGVVSGIFPAIKASMLDPVDALRHE